MKGFRSFILGTFLSWLNVLALASHLFFFPFFSCLFRFALPLRLIFSSLFGWEYKGRAQHKRKSWSTLDHGARPPAKLKRAPVAVRPMGFPFSFGRPFAFCALALRKKNPMSHFLHVELEKSFFCTCFTFCLIFRGSCGVVVSFFFFSFVSFGPILKLGLILFAWLYTKGFSCVVCYHDQIYII